MKFKHSALGRDLQEAGHITGSREWAGGEDPFKNPKDIGRAAWARIGEGFDDASAYQQIKIALMPGETRMTKILIEHKETIMDQYGKYLFEEEDTETRRKRMKMIITLIAWTWAARRPHG